MYHPLVHLLDLCTFSYQLHAQTLIWPVDPYYEQWSKADEKLRKRFMAKVHQVAPARCPNTRGPGQMVNWGRNNDLDPVLSDYSQLNALRPGVTRPTREKENWILYDTPREITKRIEYVYLVQFQPGQDPSQHRQGGQPVVSQLQHVPGLAYHDLLYCFEGGTGSVKGRPAAWSIMGFVLAREDETAPAPHPYDVYIVFRGSRSGDPRFVRALGKEKGNADWVTDMDFGAGLGVQESVPEISQVGNVGPGFAQSVKLTLPNVMECLAAIQLNKGRAPRTIHVTGHSLGAALAVHFASAVRLGLYRPDETTTPKMPNTLRHWPWSSVQLVPFSLPVVGGRSFQEAFNITLSSRRVYLSGDPVPQTIRRYAVGKEYAIVPDSPMNIDKRGVRISTARHEPYNIREYLIRDLQNKKLLPQKPAVMDAPLYEKPWKTFDSLKHLLVASASDQQLMTKPLGDILGPNITARLRQFASVLEDFVADDPVKGSKAQNLGAAIGHIANTPGYKPTLPVPFNTGPKTLRQVYEVDARGIYDGLDEFLGMCLFLSVASRATTPQEAVDWASLAPFNNFKFE